MGQGPKVKTLEAFYIEKVEVREEMMGKHEERGSLL